MPNARVTESAKIGQPIRTGNQLRSGFPPPDAVTCLLSPSASSPCPVSPARLYRMTKNGVANGTRGLPRQACMSCAQKKIRCDGERPCGRCRSALQECHDQPARVRPPGVKMRRIPRACPACIRAKARCELQRPCERCVKHGKGHLCDNPPRVPQRPGPLIPVKNALNEFMPTPEFVRDFFLRSHRYYSVDYVRSLPELRR